MAETTVGQVSRIDNGYLVRYVELVQRTAPILPGLGAHGTQIAQLVMQLVSQTFGDPDAGEEWKAAQREERMAALQKQLLTLQQKLATETQITWHAESRALFCPTLLDVQRALEHADQMQVQLLQLNAQGIPIAVQRAVALPI